MYKYKMIRSAAFVSALIFSVPAFLCQSGVIRYRYRRDIAADYRAISYSFHFYRTNC